MAPQAGNRLDGCHSFILHGNDVAYRYGSSIAYSDRLRGHDWADAEPELRSDWVSCHAGSTWDKVKDAVRYGVQRVTGNRSSH
ncbi:hypothetical protein EDC30_101284 [Paucimonas lemoignei]|uniref:Uncharacterized protein n=1 Tax=Paucimonas lemoignei TaxID=29443 RepID=A0A4R3I184_PAULE|nr:hypothetical protein [Paucimonas lemoignei]TCS39328.1 hypothetical protein EDC30_101284 [Paucimonas lemoignei]